jgi:hypothetical protein
MVELLPCVCNSVSLDWQFNRRCKILAVRLFKVKRTFALSAVELGVVVMCAGDVLCIFLNSMLGTEVTNILLRPPGYMYGNGRVMKTKTNLLTHEQRVSTGDIYVWKILNCK